jgi:HEAT repeat protein
VHAAIAALSLLCEAHPAALDETIQLLRATRDRYELEVLAAVLARFKDPEVEQAALELTTDADPIRRLAGFDLLDGLDLPGGRAAALAALDRELDARVRGAAVHALPPPRGASTAEATEVVSRLIRLLRTDGDEEVRRRAARALGDWGRAPEAQEALADALRADASPHVRAGAAFGLELIRAASPTVRAALVAAVQDTREPLLVRENAWKALGAAGPLGAAEHAAFMSYRDGRNVAIAAR